MKAIKNNRPGLYDAGGCIRLLPGLNLLDTDEKVKAWEKAKENPGVLNRLEKSIRFPEGELQEVEQASTNRVKKFKRTEPVTLPPEKIVEEPEPEPVVDGIKDLNRRGSLDAVGSCEDISTLRDWADNETKDAVVIKAIRERIEELEKEEE